MDRRLRRYQTLAGQCDDLEAELGGSPALTVTQLEAIARSAVLSEQARNAADPLTAVTVTNTLERLRTRHGLIPRRRNVVPVDVLAEYIASRYTQAPAGEPATVDQEPSSGSTTAADAVSCPAATENPPLTIRRCAAILTGLRSLRPRRRLTRCGRFTALAMSAAGLGA